MKKLWKILPILLIILSSCNPVDCTNGIQDGDETGVDCGGSCPACITTPTNSSTYDAIQGLWYKHYDVTTLESYYGGATYSNATVQIDDNCRVEFTDTDIPNSVLGSKEMKGHTVFYDYPNIYPYTINNGFLSAGANYAINKIDNDSLHLSNHAISTMRTIYNRTPLAPIEDIEDVTWEVELANGYPTTNELRIVVTINNISTNYPIIPGQTLYTGIEQVNTLSSNPKMSIIVGTAIAGSVSISSIVSFNIRLYWRGIKIAKGGEYNFCMHSGNVSDCNGIDNFVMIGGPSISW